MSIDGITLRERFLFLPGVANDWVGRYLLIVGLGRRESRGQMCPNGKSLGAESVGGVFTYCCFAFYSRVQLTVINCLSIYNKNVIMSLLPENSLQVLID